MNIKDFLRLIEEIYSYRFDKNSAPNIPGSKDVKKDANISLQIAAARYIKGKFKTKKDQVAMDFLNSIDYHRQSSVEADLFYRFFTQQYGF